MGFLHRHDGEHPTRHRMREKLFAIGDDYWIETGDGDKAFKVDGKALRIRNTFILQNADGEELFKAQQKEPHIRETMAIERHGDRVATIKKAPIAPLRDRFAIGLEGGGELEAKGTSLTTSTRSSATATRLPRCPSAGSESARPTGSRSRPARTTP